MIVHGHPSLHKIGKDPRHSTIGNKVGDQADPFIGVLHNLSKKDFLVRKWNIGPATDHFQTGIDHFGHLIFGNQPRSGTGYKDLGRQFPDPLVQFLKRDTVFNMEHITLFRQVQCLYLFKSNPFLFNDSSVLINNTYYLGSHLGKIEGRGGTHISKTLDNGSFTYYRTPINIIIVFYRYGYPESGNHIGYR